LYESVEARQKYVYLSLVLELHLKCITCDGPSSIETTSPKTEANLSAISLLFVADIKGKRSPVRRQDIRTVSRSSWSAPGLSRC